MFNMPKGTEMTTTLLQEYIEKHRKLVTKRFEPLYKAYTSEHDILKQKDKPKGKPDNRIVINFPKYIVDTMNGFFIGNPIKITAKDEGVSEFVEYLDQYNDQDDNNAELSKICSIFGLGYEMYYVDEDSNLCITYLKPTESFMIYDDSIIERPMFFVRYYKDHEGNEWGSISNAYGVRNFKIQGAVSWLEDDYAPHNFIGVPATEYKENDERQGIFEPVMTPVNAYNKAISEQANDVDYFADAYMKILGTKINKEDTYFIRDTRILNFEGEDAEKLVVEFMEKPDGNVTQENLLNRLERLIFHISMVANISDENFGAASGTSLKYKLQAMANLAKTKERKFASGMNRRYKLLFSHPLSKVPSDAWVQLKYVFTPNIPANQLEEADIATKLDGVTSKETQLRVLSVVDNVQEELDRIEEENKAPEQTIVDKMMFSDTQGIRAIEEDAAVEVGSKQLNGAQTQSLLAIMSQYSAGSLSEGQAIKLIATSINISTSEAKAILNGELNEQ